VNQSRKKELQKILEVLKEQSQALEGVKDDESDAFENKPESLRSDEDQSNADDLVEAHDSLESAITKIEEIVDR
jgi:hypothetical protein